MGKADNVKEIIVNRPYDIAEKASLRSSRPAGGRGGYALLLVLLIVAVLTGMVTEFMFTTKLHAELNANYRDRVRARYLARSSINAFQYLLETNQLRPGQIFFGASTWVGYGSGFGQLEGGEAMGQMLGLGSSPVDPSGDGPLRGQWSISMPSAGFDLEGEVYGRIINERGKINLNAIVKITPQDRMNDSRNEEVYMALSTLMRLRGIKEEDIVIFLDSLVDWIDQNTSVEPDGAEEDYYRSLDNNPYYSRNDLLVSLDEIRLIRGCTPEIFDLIKDFVTVYPYQSMTQNAMPDYRIDPAAAPKMVLMAMFLSIRPAGSDIPINDPETASLIADEIYQKAIEKASVSVSVSSGGQAQINAGQGITSAEVIAIIAGRLQGDFNRYFYDYRPTDPQYYTAIGAGQVNEVVSVAEATFRYYQNKVEFLYWRED